jgi:hypothetical protein
MNTTKTTSIKKGLIITVAFCLVLTALAACSGGGLSGTYKSGGLISQSFTFKGDDVTMSAFGINASGTYEISGDKIRITYSIFGIESSMEQSFEKKGNSIYIDGTEFVKE